MSVAKAPRLRKPAETVRTKASKAQKSNQKPRRLRRAASKGATPFKIVGRVIARVLRPFRFLLWPFKTRPARFVGRLLASVFMLRYFREAWQELRQVTWPNRRETRQLTVAVFIFAIVFSAIVAVTDYGLEQLFKKILLK